VKTRPSPFISTTRNSDEECFRRKGAAQTRQADNNRSAFKEFISVFSYVGTGNLLIWTSLLALNAGSVNRLMANLHVNIQICR
jgi:hypothetical protein